MTARVGFAKGSIKGGGSLERNKRYDEKLLLILDSACRIFAKKGYHQASIRDVASETGVSPAGLYYYFKSKEELLFLVLEARMGSLLDLVRAEAGEIEDPAARLKTIVACHLAHLEKHQEGMRALAQDWEVLSGSFGQQIRSLMREYAELVTRTLKEISPQTSPRDLRAATFGLFGMLNWVDQWHRPGRDLPMETLAVRFSEILLGGIMADAPTPREREKPEESEPAGAWSKKNAASSILSGPGF
jgi:AcrR family transcriptional regulator